MPPGFHNGRILIRTDNPDRPVIFSSINAQVIGALLVMPPTINVRFSETPGEKETQQISVEPGRVKQFNITGVVAPVEGVTADINKLSDNHYAVKLSGMPKDDSLDGKELILKTDSEASPEVRVPFKVFKMKTSQEVLNALKAPATVPGAPPAAGAPAAPAPAPAAAPAPAPAPVPAPAPAPAAEPAPAGK